MLVIFVILTLSDSGVRFVVVAADLLEVIVNRGPGLALASAFGNCCGWFAMDVAVAVEGNIPTGTAPLAFGDCCWR